MRTAESKYMERRNGKKKTGCSSVRRLRKYERAEGER